jgi:hypothetical protein
MGIDHKDFMHGAALVAIADSAEFTALNKASVKYGHYVVNHDRNLFVKYNDGRGPGDYWFTFQPTDKKLIRETAPGGRVYVVLVCGTEVITGLSRDELTGLVNLRKSEAESVKVAAAAGKQLRIKGPEGSLPPIPRNSFPQRILT